MLFVVGLLMALPVNSASAANCTSGQFNAFNNTNANGSDDPPIFRALGCL
jgi:hypothetical protein